MKCLTLPLQNSLGEHLHTVQEAIDAYMRPLEVELEQACEMCQAYINGKHYFRKTNDFVRMPKVLCICLNRWAAYGDGNTLLHPVEASRNLLMNTVNYTLCAVVCHLGETIQSGHYVAVTRHGTDADQWWLYDDSFKFKATETQVATLCSYGQRGPMHSYICIYERIY